MRVIKRKKGNSEYFYIQHAKREKGKVITKEMYIGKEIPKNIEDIMNNFQRKLNADLYNKLDIIKKHFSLHWKKLPKTVKEKEIEEVVIAFTYNTNAIEGSTITLEDARSIIQDHIAPKKALRDIKETEAHSKVFIKILGQKGIINNKLFLKWHKSIFLETKQDIAGKYRDYLVRVGPYIAPSWKDIRPMLFVMFNFIKKSKLHSVELAARAHFQFEKIHPFGDGNGRIGRLLMNHILWHSNYPMLIIEFTKRNAYYKALSKGEEAFVKYFFRTYLAANKGWLKK